MRVDGEEKRLVQSYKITNKQLRKQLQNLNNQIDKIIDFKTNRIGLKKNVAVDKNIYKTQDIKLIQVQVDNLRKRLEQLQRDDVIYKEKASINHLERAKELELDLCKKKTEKEALKRQLLQIEKSIKELNTSDLMNEQLKIYDKIEQLNQQLAYAKRIQSNLMSDVEEKKKIETKKNQLLNKYICDQNEMMSKIVPTVPKMSMPVTFTPSMVSEDEWKKLKKDFLQLKDSKYKQENDLNEENEHLRTEIRNIEIKLKHKKSTIDNIKTLEVKRKSRNYSTLEANGNPKQQNFRYRNRNNSYKYNTKS